VHRFFAPSFDPGDDSITLPRDEAEHLTRVLRLGAGDEVAVFDGRGHEVLARVAAAVRRDVRLQVLSRVEPVREPVVPVTLVQAVLKGDRMDDVVRDGVMLGAYAIQPLVTRRSETTVAALTNGARPDRWRRIALASAKQCRRAVLPDVRAPLTLESYLDDPQPSLVIMLVEPSAGSSSEPIGVLRDAPSPVDAAVLVGPEGGWAQEECAAASARGARPLSLGPRTLRADAVAVSVLSILQFLWDGY
jgi:16S rRNA (uracil1498-N3)-methyltransferase